MQPRMSHHSSTHTRGRGANTAPSAMVKVAVKWNKRVFADVEVTPTVADFKAKLQELTVRNTQLFRAVADSHQASLLL